MLILLQPGIQPLGQFDVNDDDVDLIVGGEVVGFAPTDPSEVSAADAKRPGPSVRLELGAAGRLWKVFDYYVWGFADDGTAAGLNARGYGTTFGQVIGGTVGQGTGIGDLSSLGVVTVGPSTIRGSGKVTVWDKPGLYGVTRDAFVPGNMTYSDAAESAKTPNTTLYGMPSQAQSTIVLPDEWRGKLYIADIGSAFPFTSRVGYSLGTLSDSSLVSTPAYYAGATSKEEYWAVYQVRTR